MEAELKFEFKGKEYKMSLPNVGQYMMMEVLRQRYTDGQYGAMLKGDYLSQEATYMVEMRIIMQVLCPELTSDLKVDFVDLGLKDYTELRELYMEKIRPFINDMAAMLSTVPKK
jgi:hypothetical protein